MTELTLFITSFPKKAYLMFCEVTNFDSKINWDITLFYVNPCSFAMLQIIWY